MAWLKWRGRQYAISTSHLVSTFGNRRLSKKASYAHCFRELTVLLTALMELESIRERLLLMRTQARIDEVMVGEAVEIASVFDASETLEPGKGSFDDPTATV